MHKIEFVPCIELNMNNKSHGLAACFNDQSQMRIDLKHFIDYREP